MQFVCQFNFGQVQIKGKLENCNKCTVTAITDFSDFETERNFIKAKPDSFGNFVFDLKSIHRPSIVLIEINTTKYPVYVEPKQKTWVNFSKAGDEFNYWFEKNLVAENNHLKEFFKNYNWINNKEIGSVWFEDTKVSFEGDLYEEYAIRPTEDKIGFLIGLRNEMLTNVANLPVNSISNQYKEYMATYANHASYAYLYNLARKESLSSEDIQQISQETYANTFDTTDRSNPAFIPHLKSYLAYHTSNANLTVEQFDEYFHFIWQNAIQIPMPLREEYLTYLIRENLTAINVNLYKSVITEFAQSLTDLDEIAEVVAIYNEAKAASNGRKAPNFKLVNTEGEYVSLESLKGNNIHLAFWSTSCRPCIEGMIKSKENKSIIEDGDINVKFVYISTDLNKSTWKANKHVRSAGENDIHLWVGKSAVDIKEYNAITLPTYYFINQHGNFVADFPKSWEPGFVDFVKYAY